MPAPIQEFDEIEEFDDPQDRTPTDLLEPQPSLIDRTRTPIPFRMDPQLPGPEWQKAMIPPPVEGGPSGESTRDWVQSPMEAFRRKQAIQGPSTQLLEEGAALQNNRAGEVIAPQSTAGRFMEETAQAPVRFGMAKKNAKGEYQVEMGPTPVQTGGEGSPRENTAFALPLPSDLLFSATPPGIIKDVHASVRNAAASLVNFFGSPQGVAFAGLNGAEAGVGTDWREAMKLASDGGDVRPLLNALKDPANRAVAAGFALDMAHHVPDALQAGDQALQKGDVAGATEHWLGAVATTALAYMSGKHAVSGKGAIEEFPAVEQPKTEVSNATGSLSEIAAKLNEGFARTHKAISELFPGIRIERAPEGVDIEISPDGKSLRVSPTLMDDLSRLYPGREQEVLSAAIREEQIHHEDIKSLGHDFEQKLSDLWLNAPKELRDKVRAAYGGDSKMSSHHWGAELLRMGRQATESGKITESFHKTRGEAADSAVQDLKEWFKQQGEPNALESKTTPAVRPLRDQSSESVQEMPGKGAGAQADVVGGEAKPSEAAKEVEIKPWQMTNAEQEELLGLKAKDRTDDGLSPAENERYLELSRKETNAKRHEKTQSEVGLLQGEGISIADDFLNPADGVVNHITGWTRQNNGFIQIRVETHTDQSLTTRLVTVKPGDTLRLGMDDRTVGTTRYRESNPVTKEATPQTIDQALEARGYNGLRRDKMTPEQKAEAIKEPIPTLEEDAKTWWENNDRLKNEKDLTKKFAIQAEIGDLQERIKNRNTKSPGNPPERPVPKESEAQNEKVVADEIVEFEPLDIQSGSPLQENEAVGMGAATPSEFNAPKKFTTSNKNATVDAERKARGLPPMMDLERQSNQGAWDEAMRKIDENPQVQDELITGLEEKPRAVTPTENAMLMHRRIDLRNEYEKALVRWKDAFESDNLELAAEEAQRVQRWGNELSNLEDITKRTGAESGRSLQARKMMAREDYSLASMELAAMAAKGRRLTAGETSELIRAQAKIADLQARLDAELQAQLQQELGKATNQTIKEVGEEAKSEPKTVTPESIRDDAVAGIKRKVAKGELAEITPWLQKLAKYFWMTGIREREAMIDALHGVLKTIVPDIAREDTQRAFSGYGNFKPLSKADVDVGLRDLRGQTQQVLKLEALEARKPLEKTGVERREPSDEERRLIKQVNELKRKYGVVVTDPATQLKSALAARKTYYTHRLADLKFEIEKGERTVKTKSPSPSDAELDLLKAEYEQVKKEHDSIFGERDMTDAQRLKLAIAAAERNEAVWKVKLENAEKGIFDSGRKGRTVTSPELESIRARSEALKKEVQALKDIANPKATPEQRALKALKTRLWNRTAELRQRLADKDFEKRERNPVARDREADELQAQLDIAKEDFKHGLEQDRWNKSSVFQKTKRRAADIYDAARAIMTTGELSFILRQGKFAALSHPIQTARALPDTFRSLVANEARARAIDLQVHNDPLAVKAKAAKLALVEEDVSLHKQEEILMGRLVGRLPVVRNFNRAAHIFLNKIRLDMWKDLRKSLSKSGEPTPAEDAQIAQFVNEATGRGGLGKLEAAAVPLARVFFAPRYFASRLQMAAGHSLWGGTMRTRRAIATEYARALVGLGLYYTLLKLGLSTNKDDKKNAKLSFDPRSSDFGKLVVGDTRLDPLAGMAQVITFASRMALGETKSASGVVRPIRGANLPYGSEKATDVAARFGRSKLHPVPASVANLFDGTDLAGNKTSLAGEIGGMVAPITYVDVYQALANQDLPEGTALSLLALLGEGLQTYKKKP